MTLDSLLERYRSHLQLRNFAPRGIETNFAALQLLFRFLTETKSAQSDVIGLTTATLHDFQRWHFYQPTVRGTARSIAYQNRVLSAIKSLFHFLAEENFIARDPAAALRYGREPETLPRNILTVREARQIIETPDVHTVRGYRDRTILEVLYSTGIRKQELMNLCLGDVNLEEELLRINCGKGAKDRVVPLTAVAASFLESYINAIRPQLLGARLTTNSDTSRAGRLFLSQRGAPIARNTLGELVTKYARIARIKKHVTCHLWRHTCATHLLQNKANLRHVQEILGHRSLATTERYLHLTITDLKEAHRRHHPRERTERAAGRA
ncbi:MAG: tyrosine-type recombinase/integrase [Chthoniobacterales bacterium]